MATTDARPVPIKNTAFRAYFGIYKSDGTLITGATGLDSEVSKDAGTFTDCTNEATEIATSSGIYYIDLTSTEMNADSVVLLVKSTSTGAVPVVISLYPEETGDINVDVTAYGGTAGSFSSGIPAVNATQIAGSNVSASSAQLGVNVVNVGGAAVTAASGRMEVNTTHWVGTAVATPTTAGVPEVDITFINGAAVSTTTAQLGVNTVQAGGTAWGSGAITAASIATDAIDSDAIAASALTEIADAILNRDFSAVSDTNARTLLNAARLLRNKTSVSAGTLTVTKEDDTTSAWTGAVTTSASAEPITAIDPA